VLLRISTPSPVIEPQSRLPAVIDWWTVPARAALASDRRDRGRAGGLKGLRTVAGRVSRRSLLRRNSAGMMPRREAYSSPHEPKIKFPPVTRTLEPLRRLLCAGEMAELD